MSNQDAVDKYINAACDQFNTIVKHPKVLEVVNESLFDELLDEIILGVCYDTHRMHKRGYLNLFPEEFDTNPPELNENDSHKNLNLIQCTCPKCKLSVGASGFVKHLVGCMRLGRTSSRIANMRLTNSGKDKEYASIPSDNENDMDWGSERKRKKRNTRNIKKNRKTEVNSDSSSATSIGRSSISSSVNSYASSSTNSNYKIVATDSSSKTKQICGVITKHSKKKCKNINCTHHIEQKKLQKIDDFTVDVENSEEQRSDSFDLNFNASSPTNSTQSSSKKRIKFSKSKSKSKKSSRYSEQ